MFGTINSNASDKPEFDRLKKFRNKESLKEATDFLCNNNDEAAEMLARQYKDRDGKTLGKKYEEAHEKNEEFPAVAYLLVLPILYKMYLQHKENVAEAALNGKKDEYEAFLQSVVEKGKNTPESIQQELDTYSKEQFREMSKQIIEKQKGLFSDKIKELSLDEITKVANNIQTQISNSKDIDIKTLANCLSVPVQNTQVSGLAGVNANALATLRTQQKKEISLGDLAIDTGIKNAIHGKKGNMSIDDTFRHKLDLANIQVNETFNIKYNGGCVQATRTSEKGINIL